MTFKYSIPGVFCFLVVVYGIALAVFSKTGFPEVAQPAAFFPYLSDKPIGEDAFYYLTIAWNIAAGKGAVYNYGHPTTGFQPLFMMALSGIAKFVQLTGQDKWFFVRGVILLGALLHVVFAMLLAHIAQSLSGSRFDRSGLFWICLCLTLTSFTVFRLFLYGLETGLYLIVFAVCVWRSLVWIKPDITIRQTLFLGLLFGLSCLSRIDFSVIAVVALSFCWLMRLLPIKNLILIMSLSFLIQLPWFVWVHHVSGLWMPSSSGGSTMMITFFWIRERIEAITAAWMNHMNPIIYPNIHPVWVLKINLMLLILLRIKIKDRSFFEYKHQNKIVVGWLAGLCVLAMIYLVGFKTTFFYSRYLSPLVVFFIPYLAANLLEAIRGRRVAFSIMCGVLLMAFSGFAYGSFHRGKSGNFQSELAGQIQKQIPSSLKVGVWQSGVIGYFNSNIINLDGKVNPELLVISKNDNLDRYIRKENIDIIIGLPSDYAQYKEGYEKKRWAPCAYELPTRVLCIQRTGNA